MKEVGVNTNNSYQVLPIFSLIKKDILDSLTTEELAKGLEEALNIQSDAGWDPIFSLLDRHNILADIIIFQKKEGRTLDDNSEN